MGYGLWVRGYGGSPIALIPYLLLLSMLLCLRISQSSMVISGLLRLFNIILFDKKDKLPPLKMIAPEEKI